VRVLWGSDDKLLAWPSAAARGLYELDGVGHCP
jgi:hypothetical protein